ncbi:OmpA family protein [Sneathiella aquimaris]|uniref:OmpA family protein n=1 Tax=Sneathiella aquimaris TaxID=2599305 RepID=UPI00146C5824|nr:OmpA family protein [Sneathiella aquimaris]
MKNIRHTNTVLVLSITLSSLLAACGTGPGPYNALKESESYPGSFSKALAQEYQAFAQSEIEQYDWPDQYYIAQKGLNAVSGTQPLPENLENWRLSEDDKAFMIRYRNDLVHWLNTDARIKAPLRSARAQARFDCWVEQKEENWQTADIKACQNDLQQALPKISKVHFAFDSSQLNQKSHAALETIASDWRKNPGDLIILQGHTDQVGSIPYNYKLSRKRVIAVKKQLVEAGIPEQRIQMEIWGKTRPRQEEGRHLNNEMNRRVEILKL